LVVLAANRSMARLQDEWTKDANNNGAGHRAVRMTRVEDANRDPAGSTPKRVVFARRAQL
jgi:hypothetical protein